MPVLVCELLRDTGKIIQFTFGIQLRILYFEIVRANGVLGSKIYIGKS